MSGWEYSNVSPVTEERKKVPRSVESVLNHGDKKKVVRVKAKQSKMPFSTYAKFKELKSQRMERPPDPYFTPWEKQVQAENQSRKRWVGSAFIVTDHKAAVAKREQKAAGSTCVSAGGAYSDPKEYFRDVDKSKFVGPRDFI